MSEVKQAKRNTDRERTTSFIAEVSADLHLRCQSNHGYSNFVFDTFVEGIVDVPWVASGKRTEDDRNLSRRMRWQMTEHKQ